MILSPLGRPRRGFEFREVEIGGPRGLARIGVSPSLIQFLAPGLRDFEREPGCKGRFDRSFAGVRRTHDPVLTAGKPLLVGLAHHPAFLSSAALAFRVAQAFWAGVNSAGVNSTGAGAGSALSGTGTGIGSGCGAGRVMTSS